MKSRLLDKHDIRPLLKQASLQWDIYAPLEEESGDVNFNRLKKENIERDLEKVTLEDKAVVIPPKEVFFPQLESLFEIEGEKISETVESSKKLLFGIKACDYKGILFSDGFFKRNFEDIPLLDESRIAVVPGSDGIKRFPGQ